LTSDTYVIGIAGPSASGKTELACRLVDRLQKHDPLRLPLDHYYKDLSDLEPALRAQRNFDHPDALDHDLLVRQLRDLMDGNEIEMPLYRFESHSRRAERRRVRAGELLVIDGLYALYHEELRRMIDLKVFLDADHATCLGRRIERDTQTRGRTEQSVRVQYERAVRPMYEAYVEPTRRFADLVLRGEDPVEANATRLLAHAPGPWS
jgi:uridine kinase